MLDLISTDMAQWHVDLQMQPSHSLQITRSTTPSQLNQLNGLCLCWITQCFPELKLSLTHQLLVTNITMSFGFSVGDFIAVGNLIKNICSCLQDAGGAKEEYQGLLRELDCLQQALQHLDKLQHRSSSSPTTLDSIKYAALSCRRPLEQFLGKIKKYDKSLGVWGKEGVIVNTAKKLKWEFGEKQEIRKLQNYLNIHIGTINILLAEHGLEKMDLASDKAAADQLDIRERLDNTRGIIDTISGNMAVQAMVVEKTQQTTTRLLDMISGEFRTSWRSLGEMVAKIL
jgi:hypothetical protein